MNALQISGNIHPGKQETNSLSVNTVISSRTRRQLLYMTERRRWEGARTSHCGIAGRCELRENASSGGAHIISSNGVKSQTTAFLGTPGPESIGTLLQSIREHKKTQEHKKQLCCLTLVTKIHLLPRKCHHE